MSEEDISDWVSLSVKYKGNCKVCGKEIPIGAPALWSRGLRAIKHQTCEPHISEQPAPAAEGVKVHFQASSCSKCGTAIEKPGVKFCQNCGNILIDLKEEPRNGPDVARQTDIEGLSKEEIEQSKTNPVLTPSELGAKLEDMTVELLKGMGYSTEVRQLFNIKGVPYEIDVIARKGDQLMAVECKNYSHPVGIAELREFHDKIVDLKFTDALFVTNSIFTDNAIAYADSKNIRHWDRREFYEKFGDMMAGRYGSNQEIALYLALPIVIRHGEAKKLLLKNSSKVRISKSKLILYPYYKFDYRLDIQRTDPVRNSHRVTDDGSIIVDSLSGEVLAPRKPKGHNNLKPEESNEEFENREQYAIIGDLLSVHPESQYKLRPETDYEIRLLRRDVSLKNAKTIALERVVVMNTTNFDYRKRISRDTTVKRSYTVIPKPYEVWIKKASMIYVPKWVIEFEANGRTYTRKLIASSGTIVRDNITSCPRHFLLGKISFKPKSTFAICEMCGLALCEDHIRKVGENYYCQDHDPSKPADSQKGAANSLKKGLGGLGKLVRGKT